MQRWVRHCVTYISTIEKWTTKKYCDTAGCVRITFFLLWLLHVWEGGVGAYSLLVTNLGTTNAKVTDNYPSGLYLRNFPSQNFFTWTSVISCFFNSCDYSMSKFPAMSSRLRRMYRTCCFASVLVRWCVSSFSRCVKAKRVCRVTFMFSDQSFPPLFGQLHLLLLFAWDNFYTNYWNPSPDMCHRVWIWRCAVLWSQSHWHTRPRSHSRAGPCSSTCVAHPLTCPRPCSLTWLTCLRVRKGIVDHNFPFLLNSTFPYLIRTPLTIRLQRSHHGVLNLCRVRTQAESNRGTLPSWLDLTLTTLLLIRILLRPMQPRQHSSFSVHRARASPSWLRLAQTSRRPQRTSPLTLPHCGGAQQLYFNLRECFSFPVHGIIVLSVVPFSNVTLFAHSVLMFSRTFTYHCQCFTILLQFIGDGFGCVQSLLGHHLGSLDLHRGSCNRFIEIMG